LSSTLFPYTPLFRSILVAGDDVGLPVEVADGEELVAARETRVIARRQRGRREVGEGAAAEVGAGLDLVPLEVVAVRDGVLLLLVLPDDDEVVAGPDGGLRVGEPAAEEEEQREGVTNEAFHGSLQEWVRRSAGGRRPARETREQGHQHWGRARIALRLLPGVASHHGGTSRVPPRGAAVCGARARSRVGAPALPLRRKGRSACRRS